MPGGPRRDRHGNIQWGHGGWRPGAGRKPKGEFACVKHRPRARVTSRSPVHVVLRVKQGLPPLQRRAEYEAICEALADVGTGRVDLADFRLCHFSCRDGQVDLLVEARNGSTFSRGAQGLSIRIARGLNRLWGRKGKFYGDRFEEQVLRTPREVRDTLVRVFRGCVPFSSAPWFDGFKKPVAPRSDLPRPVADPRTPLLARQWRKHGLLSPAELRG